MKLRCSPLRLTCSEYGEFKQSEKAQLTLTRVILEEEHKQLEIFVCASLILYGTA